MQMAKSSDGLRNVSVNKKQILFIVVLLILSAVMIFAAVRYGEQNQFEYRENLDQMIFTLDETEYLLRDMTFYIARQELQIEEQARVYDADDTNKFWSIHTNGSFVRLDGKKAVLDRAVHDSLLCAEARTRGLKLSEKEQSYADSAASDLTYDLTEEQKKRAGLTDEEIYEMTGRAALAEKCQRILAEENECSFGAFDYNGKAYQKLLEEHKLKVNEKLWEKVPFGNVAFNHRFE